MTWSSTSRLSVFHELFHHSRVSGRGLSPAAMARDPVMKLLATVLAFLAVAWLIGTLLGFQRRKLFYSPVRQTIGELAEFGFPPFREVSRHGFLPTRPPGHRFLYQRRARA